MSGLRISKEALVAEGMARYEAAQVAQRAVKQARKELEPLFHSLLEEEVSDGKILTLNAGGEHSYGYSAKVSNGRAYGNVCLIQGNPSIDIVSNIAFSRWRVHAISVRSQDDHSRLGNDLVTLHGYIFPSVSYSDKSTYSLMQEALMRLYAKSTPVDSAG